MSSIDFSGDDLAVMHYTDLDKAPEIFKNKLTIEEQKIYLSLDHAKIESYYEIFEIFDNTGDGNIDEDEIGQVMQGLGQKQSQERIKEMI